MNFYKTISITKAKHEEIMGTGFKGYLVAEYETLVRTFGEPHQTGSADDKVKAQWAFNINGSIITIYDYKEDKRAENVTEWHVGGKKITPEAFRYLYEEVKKNRAGAEYPIWTDLIKSDNK